MKDPEKGGDKLEFVILGNVEVKGKGVIAELMRMPPVPTPIGSFVTSLFPTPSGLSTEIPLDLIGYPYPLPKETEIPPSPGFIPVLPLGQKNEPIMASYFAIIERPFSISLTTPEDT